MQRQTVSSDAQHQIVLAIQDYVTQTFTLMHRFYSVKPNPIITPTVDFAELIKKLDDFHRKQLESFLEEKLGKRHYFSIRTAMSANIESVVAGVILSGLGATSLPVSLTLYGATILVTHIVEQVGHQYTVASRAQTVAIALETVKKLEALEAEKAQEAEKMKQASNLLGSTIFAEKTNQHTMPLDQEVSCTQQSDNGLMKKSA